MIGFTACDVEDGESGSQKTIQGRIAFETTKGFISDDIFILDLMIKVNYYAQVSNSSNSMTLNEGKLSIKDNQKDNISVAISYPKYRITFNGITEDWDYYYYW